VCNLCTATKRMCMYMVACTGRSNGHICMHILYVQNGYRPLYIASATGHTEVVDVLLNNRADLKLAIMVWRLACSFHLLHWGKNC